MIHLRVIDRRMLRHFDGHPEPLVGALMHAPQLGSDGHPEPLVGALMHAPQRVTASPAATRFAFHALYLG